MFFSWSRLFWLSPTQGNAWREEQSNHRYTIVIRRNRWNQNSDDHDFAIVTVGENKLLDKNSSAQKHKVTASWPKARQITRLLLRREKSGVER